MERQREDTAALGVKGWRMSTSTTTAGANGKGRPEWERLLADIEAGKIDAVAPGTRTASTA